MIAIIREIPKHRQVAICHCWAPSADERVSTFISMPFSINLALAGYVLHTAFRHLAEKTVTSVFKGIGAGRFCFKKQANFSRSFFPSPINMDLEHALTVSCSSCSASSSPFCHGLRVLHPLRLQWLTRRAFSKRFEVERRQRFLNINQMPVLIDGQAFQSPNDNRRYFPRSQVPFCPQMPPLKINLKQDVQSLQCSGCSRSRGPRRVAAGRRKPGVTACTAASSSFFWKPLSRGRGFGYSQF